jgi:hypothetical protein
MNRQLAQLVNVGGGRRSRWFGPGISACVVHPETGAAQQKSALHWDKVLGLGIVLVIVALGWTAVGFAVSHFLR